MSAISGFINTIRNAVYGEQVRGAIASALEACYSDVENPDLQSAAFLAAINTAYASGILDITEVTQVSQMTNENIIYRYMGTQTGYTANTLYYHNGTAWVPIGSGLRTASNSNQMTDTGAIYKYTGTQSGYTQNALYYYNGSSWVELQTVEDEDEGSETTTDTFYFTEQYYRTDTGSTIENTLSTSTVLIPIAGQTFIKYTGRTGGTCASWFTANKTFISKTTDAQTTKVEYNVLQDAPSNAAYVELMSRTTQHSSPPTSDPIVTVSNPITIVTSHKIHGDGTSDDTAALQWMVDNKAKVELDSEMIIKITSPIIINPAVCKYFDGKNARIKIDGNFSAFSVVGSMTTGQTASTPPSTSIHQEANFVFKNVRICNTNNEGSSYPSSASGTGITLSGTFKAKLENCYIYMVNNGISVEGVNRDLMISNCHVYNAYTYGLVFNEGVDIHQCNIVNNIFEYAFKALAIVNPLSLANFQIVGNDIEIGSLPSTRSSKTDFKCIEIVSGSTFGAQPILQEIEISGNTIQGHSGSNTIIKMVGDTNRKIRLCSIVGNHISNSSGVGIDLELCDNFAISGNTFAVISGSAVKMTNCSVVAIGSNTATEVGRLANLLTNNSNIKISDNVASGGVAASGVVVRSFIDGNLWTSGASSLLPDSGLIINMNNSHASGQSDTTNEYVTNAA